MASRKNIVFFFEHNEVDDDLTNEFRHFIF